MPSDVLQFPPMPPIPTFSQSVSENYAQRAAYDAAMKGGAT